MIYLDYAANTPVDDKVLEEFVLATKKYIANPNSSHKLGVEAKEKIDECSVKIADYFNYTKDSVIYTSGSSEANNLVIKGIALRNKDKGKHIIISAVEHSSIVAPCNYLTDLGFDVSVIPLTKEGIIDLEVLKKTINDETILVSICYVDSELGTIQPIEEIGSIVKEYPNCVFHTDATQAIGKIKVDFSNCDFVTFAPHKFYGLNGFGVLLNKNNVTINPLIHGGKSTTIYRSGTPVTANVVALKKALELAMDNLDERYNYISRLKTYLKEELIKYENIHINSPENSIPNTLNFSLVNMNAKEMVKLLNENNVCLSTTSACSIGDMPSKAVLAITNDMNLAKNSIRISLSHLTTLEEINNFLKVFDECYKKIRNV